VALGLEPLLTVYFECLDPFVVGERAAGGLRRVTQIVGGTFSGPELAGEVVSGLDAVIVRPDGTVQVDVRAVLRTDADELVYTAYHGLRTAPPEYRELLRTARPIPEGADYFRCAFTFETTAPRLLWLNDLIAVGAGRRDENGPFYDVHKVT
jgi:hypothetical protein